LCSGEPLGGLLVTIKNLELDYKLQDWDLAGQIV
jgi:hypothetical protein